MPTLNWIGKEAVINHHHDVPFKTLNKKYTFDNGETIVDVGRDVARHVSTTENKIIHGDNLEALKALLPEYEGKIKCIYIDPPYNTGNENWVYNDNVNSPRIRKWLGQVVGKEAEDLTRHDKWLCMMYPRLKLLHQLLADDGAIFISIDDNEQANLKLICDEIFGSGNFRNIVICRRHVKSLNKQFEEKGLVSLNIGFEYIMVYSKTPKFSMPIIYAQKDADTESKWQGFWSNADRPTMRYEILGFTPTTGQWRKSKEKADVAVKNYQEYEAKYSDKMTLDEYYQKTGIKDFIRRLPQGNGKNGGVMHWQAPSDKVMRTTSWMDLEASQIHKEIDLEFNNPKNRSLIEEIFKLVPSDSIILDSFAGSGTTAHAVLNLNKQDGGNRKFILVEMEDYAETITAERVRRVINGYGEGKNAVEGTGGSFSYYELGEPMMNGDYLNENQTVEKIREYIWYTETRVPFCRDCVHTVSTNNTVRHVSTGNIYYLGNYNNSGYYFYYQKEGITTLDKAFLNTITVRADQYIIYADNCLLNEEFMRVNHIIFKKIPRDIRKF